MKHSYLNDRDGVRPVVNINPPGLFSLLILPTLILICSLFAVNIFSPRLANANPGKTTTCLNCHNAENTGASIFVAVEGAEVSTASNYVLSSYTGSTLDVEIDYVFKNNTEAAGGETVALMVSTPSGWAITPGTVNSPTGTNFGANWSSAWDIATSNLSTTETYYTVSTGDTTYYPNSPDQYSIYWNNHNGSGWDAGRNKGAFDDASAGDLDGMAETMGTDFRITVPTGLTAGTTHEIVVHGIGHLGSAKSYVRTTLTLEIPSAGDTTPPTFGGLTGAADAGTGGAVDLTWNAASDPSTPITYNIYWSTTSGGQNFTTPNMTSSVVTGDTATSLTNGQIYYFVVRAEDSVGNEDTNTVEFSATPTAPDTTPPTFGGLNGAADAGTGGSVNLTWNAASDPSTPITYNIYWSITSGGQNFTTPDMTSSSGTGDSATGLTDDQIYYFVVRAEDSVGNEDTNTVEFSATPTTAPVCTYNTPTVSILTSDSNITTDGGFVDYTIQVTNNDVDLGGCPATSFNLLVADTNATNFYGSFLGENPISALPDGGTAQTIIRVTSKANEANGPTNDTYFYTAADGNHSQSANSNIVTTTINVTGIECISEGSYINTNGDQLITSRE